MSIKKIIHILVDNDSWIIPYAEKLQKEILSLGYDCEFVRHSPDIKKGHILFLLGCTKIIDKETLTFNTHNIVIHESNLPSGKGYAPLFWQILEGKDNVPVCLFEATDSVDAGVIYARSQINLEGHELNSEIRHLQGIKTIEMCLNFLNDECPVGEVQNGEESHYKRRTPKDSELDLNKTIESQFNLLRVVDNEKYPAFFIRNGIKYVLKIEKSADE